MTTEVALLERPPSPLGLPRLRALVENTFDTIAIVDAHGRIMYESPSTTRVLGHDPLERQSASGFDHVHPDDQEYAHAILRDLVQGRVLRMRAEIRVLHKDGGYRLLETSLTSLLEDPSVQGIIVVARDITEQRAGEQERARLLASERQARTSAERAFDQLLSLQSVSAAFGSALTADSVAAVAVDRGVAALGAIAGSMALLTPSGEAIDLYRSAVSAPGRRRWRRIAADAPIPVAEAIRRAEPVWIESVRAWNLISPRIASKRPRAHRAAAALPIDVNGHLAGGLGLHFDHDRQFSETDRLFMSLLARQCGQALERVRLYQELAVREQRLQELVHRLLAGQEEERRRVAYELHDGLAQVAAGTHQHLQTLASRCAVQLQSPELRIELQRALELAQRTVREARSLIHGLRPTVLDDFGLVRALHVEVEALRADGCAVRFDGSLGDERLPQIVETALYRVVQEGLTNIRKHAGTCRVHVSVRRRGHTIRLVVRDWGRGFCVNATRGAGVAHGMHVGLAGMQERVALLGGRCVIRSRAGQGTTIEVTVPVSAMREPVSDKGAA